MLVEPCSLWGGAIEKTGYGRRKVAGKMWMAHRYAYFLAYGEIPDGLVVDHLCFNRACVEVTRLRLLSREENARRHNPACACVSCAPYSHRVPACAKGHDMSRPELRTKPRNGRLVGDCLECRREKDRARKRRQRASLRDVAV